MSQNRLTTEGVLQALNMAIRRRKPKNRVLIDSDYGSQFTSIDRAAFIRTGNAQARTMLVEAGWSYRLPAREERRYRERVFDLAEEIQAIGLKAQVGLCQRYCRLAPLGRPHPKVTTSIARQLVGYAQDVARRVPPAVAG